MCEERPALCCFGVCDERCVQLHWKNANYLHHSLMFNSRPQTLSYVTCCLSYNVRVKCGFQ